MNKIFAGMFLCWLLSSFVLQVTDDKKFYNIGVKNIKESQYAEAIANFTQAISLNPRFADAYLQRAKAKLMLGEQMGYFVKDLYNDLIRAKELGSKEAWQLLYDHYHAECSTPEDGQLNPKETFCLDYRDTKLTKLPNNTAQMTNLLALHLSDNQLGSLPELPVTKHLLVLDLDNNLIRKLPANLHLCTSLVELNISTNNISLLPNEIGNLANLKNFYLRNNKLNQLPASFTKLTDLEVLDISLNNFTAIPKVLFQLKNLKALYLSGNNLAEKDVNDLKHALPSTVIYY